MNVDQYQQLLYSYRENPQQASNIIIEMSNKNMLLFLELNLSLLSQSKDTDLLNFAILLIYRFSKNQFIFKTENCPQIFWPNFARIIPTVFESTIFSENSKNLVSLIISYFATYFHSIAGDTQIQIFLLELLRQAPQFETYIITSISEIIISSQEYGGFPPDILLQFCTMNLQFPNSIIPRLKLYFAFSMRFFTLCNPDDQNCIQSKQLLISLFLELFKQTPEEFLGKFISTTGLFAESFAVFFEDHIGVFIPVLCSLASNQACPFRNDAIFCIESFAVGSINMCSSYETYYQPVLKCLLSIMAEINDQSPLNEELNDNSSYIIAQHAARTFLEECVNLSVYDFLFDYFRETIAHFSGGNGSYDKVPWPIMHSFIIALSYQNFHILDLNDDEERISSTSHRIEFLHSFEPFLTNPGTVPHIRIAIYDMITILSQQIMYSLYAKMDQKLMPILYENSRNETNQYIQLSCISAFTEFSRCAKKIPNQENQFDPTGIFVSIMNDLMNFPHHLMPYYLTILKSFMHYQTENPNPQLFQAFAESILQLYQAIKSSRDNNVAQLSGEDAEIVCKVFTTLIEAFILPTRSIEEKLTKNKAFFYSIPGLPQQTIILLDDCLFLLLQDKVMDVVSLKSAILKCLLFLNEDAIPIINKYKLFETSLETCDKDYDILQYGQFDSIEVNSTTLTKIEGAPESRQKFFLYKNDHDDLCYSLKLLLRIFQIVSSQLDLNSIEQVIKICQAWITNSYHIEKVKFRCYRLLLACFQLKSADGGFQQLSRIIIDDICNDLDKGSISFKFKLLSTLLFMLQGAMVDPEQIPKLIDSLVKLTDHTLTCIKEINAELFKYKLAEPTLDEEKMPRKVSFCRSLLDYESGIPKIYSLLMKHYPEQTIPFIQNKYLGILSEYMKYDESIEFSLGVMTYYVSQVGDLSLAVGLLNKLMEYTLVENHPLSSKSFILLTDIFHNVHLPADCLPHLVTQFCHLLKSLIDVYTEETNDLDLALCTFASLILQHTAELMQLQPTMQSEADEEFTTLYDQSVSFFLLAFPYKDYNTIVEYSLCLVVQLFQTRNRFIMSELHLTRIMAWITSNFHSKDLMVGFEKAFRAIIKSFDAEIKMRTLSPECFDDFTQQGWENWKNIVESQDDETTDEE